MSSIILEIRSEDRRLKLSWLNQRESTVTYFEEREIDHQEIADYSRELMSLLDKSVRGKNSGKTDLEHFQNLGLHLYDLLFTSRIKEKLHDCPADNLILKIDEDLVSIPWELLYDGEEFLSLRFSLGRMVYTRLAGIDQHRTRQSLPLKVLIIADPKDDLPSAYQEGVGIMERLVGQPHFVDVDFKATQVTPRTLKLCIRNYDIVHYAGHATYNQNDPSESGWLMAGNRLSAREIISLGNPKKPMPALVFANACQSGISDWEIDERYNRQIFGMANAFLLSGVTHYLGTYRNILDKPSGEFAEIFYKELLDNNSIGIALRNARKEITRRFGKPGGSIFTSPAVSNKNIFVGSDDGYIYS